MISLGFSRDKISYFKKIFSQIKKIQFLKKFIFLLCKPSFIFAVNNI